MTETNMLTYIDNVLRHMPQSWLQLTTHRLDIYDENLAKTQFLEQFEELYHQQNSEKAALADLPTAYDYIRLGHPLSCILEWAMGRLHSLPAENVISFSSYPMPILAILRKNSLDQTPTRIFYTAEVPPILEGDLLQRVYGYDFELLKVHNLAEISEGEGSSVFISRSDTITQSELHPAVDFYVTAYSNLGSILMVQHEKNHNYISEIQHVRRRETIAMTPANVGLFCILHLVHRSSVQTDQTSHWLSQQVLLLHQVPSLDCLACS